MVAAAKRAPQPLQGGRRRPVLEGGAVAQRAGLAQQHRQVVPGIEHRAVAAELAGVLGHDAIRVGLHLHGKESLAEADVDAIRAGQSSLDGKLGALSTLARILIEKRGRLSDEDRNGFLVAGFTEEHLLEVVAVSAASTITN